ncbi:MAG: hypothetical protein FJW32_21105 [Acidobacteria bacterium]|nr:hypothetical protein [Acidobacteriota bacterium]
MIVAMSLSPSTRIGQYEIQALIGAGGMGEVYRALDTRLNRTVAVKVLPLALSNDSSYMQRFQREAQVLASLNHPHIAAIYGLEQNAIIMELVEGPTLAERQGLSIDEAISIARQIAEALEYAHDKNVIHRDLKPGNVKITPAGVVKVLDFGLAKVVEPAPAVISANSPTLTMRATEVGVILGTASYMAPEQAAGKSVDKRADIWSFGVVLWEMLTGRRLFDGETVSHTLADVLRAPIDLDAVPASTPRAVRELVRRCLERDERKRLRDIGEARILLENPVAEAAPVAVATRRGLPYWAAAACLAPAAVMGVLQWREQPPAAPIVKFTIDAPKSGLAQTRFGPPRISPDGTRILMLVTGESGERQSGAIWIRRLDAVQMQPLAGTEGATYPFWSGDGRHIGFCADGKLKRVAVDGGPPVTVCAAPSGRGGTWHGGVDGVIIFAANQQVPLSSVAASGGEPRSVTALDPARKEASHRVPHFLPDGQRFLYIAGDAEFTNAAVYAAELVANGSKPAIGQLVVQSATEAMWASSGHLL